MPTKPGKTKPKSPTNPNPPAPPPAPPPPPTDPVDTLEDLTTRAGAATEAEALAYVEGLTNAQLVAAGKKVSTSRIDVDAARLYGKALHFFTGATQEQRAALPGITPDMLRVAIWTARQGQMKAEQRARETGTQGDGKETRQIDASIIRAEALTRRDQLHSALQALGKKDPLTRKHIAAAYGSILTPSDHAVSLVAMVKLCRTMLADTSPGAVMRRKGTAITEAWLAGTEALAERVKKTGAAAAAVLGHSDVTQAEVDLYDGINLRLLKIFIDAFETANAVDPQIPRLVPSSLRRWFNRGQRPAAADDDGDGEEAAVDAEPAAEGDTKVAAGAEAAKAPDAATAKATGPAAGKAKTTVKG